MYHFRRKLIPAVIWHEIKNRFKNRSCWLRMITHLKTNLLNKPMVDEMRNEFFFLNNLQS